MGEDITAEKGIRAEEEGAASFGERTF